MVSRTRAKPGALLPVDNAKRRRETTELHLAHRGIEVLPAEEMAQFPNLKLLWINDNKLVKLKGLDGNVRLASLCAQNNRIQDISAPSCSLRKCTNLETLLLHNNAIANLDATLDVLARMTHLSVLSLEKNPVAEEAYYRDRIVHRLRALTVLDNDAITARERAEADARVAPPKITRPFGFGAPVAPWRKPPAQARFSLSATERLLAREVAQARARRSAAAGPDAVMAEDPAPEDGRVGQPSSGSRPSKQATVEEALVSALTAAAAQGLDSVGQAKAGLAAMGARPTEGDVHAALALAADDPSPDGLAAALLGASEHFFSLATARCARCASGPAQGYANMGSPTDSSLPPPPHPHLPPPPLPRQQR